jgi:hypothetical protein
MKIILIAFLLSVFTVASANEQNSADANKPLNVKKSYPLNAFNKIEIQSEKISFKSIGDNDAHFLMIHNLGEESLDFKVENGVLKIKMKEEFKNSDLSIAYKGKLASLSVLTKDFKADIKNQTETNIEIKTKNLQFVSKDSSGNLAINAYEGAVEIDSFKGDVSLKSYGVNALIKKVEGNLSIESFNADNKFYNLKGNLGLEVNQGNVEIEQMEGDLKYNSHAADILTRAIKGDLRLKSKLGNVKLFLEEGGSVRVRSEEAKVNVYMPKNSGAHINIGSSDGDIDFPKYIELKRYPSVKVATGRLRGRLGGSVFVRSDKGDIRLIAR